MVTALQTATLPDWRELARLPDEELGKYDIAVVNLAVAAGLPGAEKIDLRFCLDRLTHFARRVKKFTDKVLGQFYRQPDEYENSEAYFRILCMVTVLQKDLGFRYNPEKIGSKDPFEPEDIYLHGVLRTGAGTCASLPVLYAAVGRRLGYPLKLVSTIARSGYGHLFARWEGADGERFNVECTGRGFSCLPDDEYRAGRVYHLPPGWERAGLYLMSKTPRRELAGFVNERGYYWRDHGDLRQAVLSYAAAAAMVPESLVFRDTLLERMKDWGERLDGRKPPSFPGVRVKLPPPQLFSARLPLDLDLSICCLMAADNLLRDPDWSPVWERMRRPGWSGRVPSLAKFDFRPDSSCTMRFEA